MRSLASSDIGPNGFIFCDTEIQESCHTLVVNPFPIAFPRLVLSRSRPLSMPFHPWEHEADVDIFKKLLLRQYFPVNTLAIRHPGLVRILQDIFASKA